MADESALFFLDCPLVCPKTKQPPANQAGCDSCPVRKREEFEFPKTARQYVKEFSGRDAELEDAELQSLADQVGVVALDCRRSGDGYPADVTDVQMRMMDIYRSEQHKAERRYLAKLRKDK